MFFFFFNDTATTEIYTLSLHDALPISRRAERGPGGGPDLRRGGHGGRPGVNPLDRQVRDIHTAAAQIMVRSGTYEAGDRKSTRLNSSHANISYAVFCLKKKKMNKHSKI